MSMHKCRVVTGTILEALVVATTGACFLCATGAAQAGPCTAQIAQVKQEISKAQAASSPGGAGTPSAQQSIGAQLHHQPTVQSIQRAEDTAAAQAAEALDRASVADKRGDAQACESALHDAKELYGLQ